MPVLSKSDRSRRRRNPQRRTLGLVIGAALLILAIVAVGVALVGRSDPGLAERVESTDWSTLTSQHVDAPVVYASNPPVGGDHSAAPANWGVYPLTSSAPTDEHLVHNMEHGGIIIWFDPAVFTGAQYDELFSIYQGLTAINYRTLLVARSGMATPLAVTAWGQLLRLDTLDANLIEEFYRAYILHGPECTTSSCPA